MAKSPARTVRTQSNPIFMSLYATARLEILSAQQGLNKFALKSKLYINAYERPLLSTVFGRLFQGGLPLRLNHY
jgi:hypothetical protein